MNIFNRSKSFKRVDSIEKRNQLNKFKDTIETLQTSHSNSTFENGIYPNNNHPDNMPRVQLNFHSIEDQTEQDDRTVTE